MKVDKENKIGEIVANDFRTAGIFEAFGLDFCCGGGRELDKLCEEKQIDVSEVLNKIQALDHFDNTNNDFNDWSLDKLIDYIENTHHRYVEEKMPVIDAFLDKLSRIHKLKHPELVEVNKLFKSSKADLAQHMKKEELILFPYIKKMLRSEIDGTTFENPSFNSVSYPIQSMFADHNNEGQRFEKMAELTDNFKVPEDGCRTYFVAMNMLKEFEEDLHIHIHLENNLLFPKAIDKENKLRA